MNLEILLTTFNHPSPLRLAESLGINNNVLIGNQCGKDSINIFNGIKIINSSNVGCSVNRNMLIKHSSADFILFADDDQHFYDSFYQTIEDGFKQFPDANAIYFKINVTSCIRSVRMFNKSKKAKWKDVSPLGVWGLVIKREFLVKNNLNFRENFGPGTKNPFGEDSLFLKDLLKKTNKVYLFNQPIAYITQEESTWFKGYDSNYFYNLGKVYYLLFGKFYFISAFKMSIYFLFAKHINPFLSLKYIIRGSKYIRKNEYEN